MDKVIKLDNILPNINSKVVIQYTSEDYHSIYPRDIIAVDRYLIDWSKSDMHRIVLTEEGIKEVSKVIGKITIDNFHYFTKYTKGELRLRINNT